MKLLLPSRFFQWGVSLLFALPLVFTSHTMYPWHFGKSLLFVVGVDLLLLGSLWYGVSKKTPLPRPTTIDWALLAFTVAFLVAGVVGVNPERSFWGYQSRFQGTFMYLHYFGLYTLLRIWFRTKGEWQALFRWIVGVASISSLVAWIGYLTPLFPGMIRHDGRLSGIVGNPLFFSAYLVVPFGLALLLFVWEKERARRAVLGCITLFLLLSLFAAQSRGALLGFIMAFLVTSVVAGIGTRTPSSRRVVFSGLIGVALLIGFIFLATMTPLRTHLPPQVSRLFQIGVGETSVQTRLLAWKTGFVALKERPIFGWGPENFQYAFDAHYDPTFLIFSLGETIWDKAHNHIVEIFVTGGVVSGFLFLALIVLLLGTVLSKKQSKEAVPAERYVLFGTILFFVGQSFFGIETIHSQMLWYVLLAYVSHLSLGDESVVLGRFGGYGRGAVTLLFTLPLLFFALRSIGLYQASTAMGAARDLVAAQEYSEWPRAVQHALDTPTPYAWENAFFGLQDFSRIPDKTLSKEDVTLIMHRLISTWTDAQKKAPTTYEYELWLGEAYAYLGEYGDATNFAISDQHLTRAGELSPGNQRVPILLSKNLLLQGKQEEAIAVLAELARTNPTAGDAHWFYGLSLVEAGKQEEGMGEISKAIQLGGSFWNQEGNVHYVIDLYAKKGEYDTIIPLYLRLIALHPTDASLWANLAATYASAGKKAEARTAVEHAVSLDPSLQSEADGFITQFHLND